MNKINASLNVKKIYDVFLNIIFFMYVFAPPIVSGNIYLLVEFLCLAAICVLIVKEKGKIKVSRFFINFYLSFVPFFIYIFFIGLFYCATDYGNSSVYMGNITLIIRLLIRCTIPIVYIEINNYSKKTIIINDVYIVNVAVAQVICILLAIFIPSVRKTFINLMINNSNSEVIIRQLTNISSRRCYGFANNLFDAFGYILSFIICYIYYMYLEKGEKKYLILVFLLVLGCAVNTRTGVVLALISLFLCTVIYKKNKKQIRFTLLAVFGFPVFIYCLYIFLRSNFQSTFEWLGIGINEIISLIINRTSEGTFSKLFVSDMVFPSDTLFGAGAPPEYLTRFEFDMGYIQCLWRYGIVGTILLIGGYIRIIGMSMIKNRVLAIGYIIIILVYLFKIYSFNNIGANFIIFYSCYYYWKKMHNC